MEDKGRDKTTSPSLINIDKENSMARIETTGGDIVITVDQCDCGLTGGCSMCRPVIIPRVIPYLVDLVEKGMEDLKAGRYKAYKKT